MAAPAAAPGHPKIELLLACRELPSFDKLSKSDPMVVVLTKDEATGGRKEIGRTEMIKDNADPNFKRSIKCDYFFEKTQELFFMVYDVDSDDAKLENQDLIGQTSSTVAKLLTSGRTTEMLLKDLHGNFKGQSRILINCEEMKGETDVISFSLKGLNLDKKDTFGSSDPFFSISRSVSDDNKSKWIQIYKSETIKNNLNPSWKAFKLMNHALCNGDAHRPILFQVFDEDEHSDNDLIGECQVTLAQILQNKPVQFELIHPKNDSKTKKKISGTLVFERAELERNWTFMDFVFGGLQLNFMVAVDFTGSNGDPNDKNSLHTIHVENNAYQEAIREVGNVIAAYDSDQHFLAWGFGAIVPPGKKVDHCFALAGDSKQEVVGVQGILDAYSEARKLVKLSGPTHFSEVLEVVRATAIQECSPQSQRYSVLMFLTDGEINDMDQTVSNIVQCSKDPISIIIIGVGNSDFDKMKTLDADNGALKFKGNQAVRDIVQFVAMKDYNHNAAKLAGEVLAEIPQQVVSFMKLHKIKPKGM